MKLGGGRKILFGKSDSLKLLEGIKVVENLFQQLLNNYVNWYYTKLEK